MKAFLLYKDKDFDLQESPPAHAEELIQDLELNILFNTMAAGDPFLLDIVKKAVLRSLDEPEAILYRQHILADCLQYPSVVKELYSIAVEAIEGEKAVWGWVFGRQDPEGQLHRSIEVLQLFMGLLKKLRMVAGANSAAFESEGFKRLFGMFESELDAAYLAIIEEQINQLIFPQGMRMSARLGQDGKSTHYVLHQTPTIRYSWLTRLWIWMKTALRPARPRFIYRVPDRDESGLNALSELRKHGVSNVATAVAQSTDHILNFFMMLRAELGFYIGCLNLHEKLAQNKAPTCFPVPGIMKRPLLSCQELYDISLRLSTGNTVIGNDIAGDDKMLVMVTGANRGGKTTFLRSIGLAQLMMQCGMFVPARSFSANICSSVFTHFKRKEDAGMRSGKLDEELDRMSQIVSWIKPGSLVLLNESFSSTNEREGSEIARQIIRALVEGGIKVLYVTHMFDLAQSFYQANMPSVLFLRAGRLASGQRTFRLAEGKPLSTSYGEDLYKRIFESVETN